MAELTVAADVAEARAWLDTSEYDLAVLDPGDRSSELLPTLGGRVPPVPALVSASRPGAADVVREIAAALDGSTLTADPVLAATRAAMGDAPPALSPVPASRAQTAHTE